MPGGPCAAVGDNRPHRRVSRCGVRLHGRYRHSQCRWVRHGLPAMLRPAGCGEMGNSLVTDALQTKRCTHLSAKSSMSKMAACNSKCSWKKRTMMLLSASGSNDEVVTPTPDKRPLLALNLGEDVMLC